MIVTLTPNTALDLNVYIPGFKPGMVRASRSGYSMGGKAADAAYILGRLGIPSRALGFAAGMTGQRMEAMLRARGVLTDFTWVEGETRLNPMITCEDGSGETTIGVDTLRVRPEHLADLESRLGSALSGASCLALGGSLPGDVPPEYYARWIELARDHQIPTLFDASGAGLRAGMQARPMLVKPNRQELADLVGADPQTIEETRQVARQVQSQYGSWVVVTLGEQGILAVIGEQSYWAPALPVQVVSTAGAGDGLLAGLCMAFENRQAIVEGLRWGTAIAGAVVSQPWTADCQPEVVARWLPEVVVRSLA